MQKERKERTSTEPSSIAPTRSSLLPPERLNAVVILAGCSRKALAKAREKSDMDFVAVDDADSLMFAIEGKDPLPIVMLGPRIDAGEGRKPSVSDETRQTNVFARLKKIHPNIKVVGVVQRNEGVMQDFFDMKEEEATRESQARFLMLAETGMDACVYDSNLENFGDDVRKILGSLKEDSKSRYGSVICEVKEGQIFKVDESRLPKARQTMRRFAEVFNAHQHYSGHYAVMRLLMYTLRDHFGTKIVDLGCGTGYPMRSFIKEMMGPQFLGGVRDHTTVFSVDQEMDMLVQARRGYETMIGRNEFIRRRVDMIFMECDLLGLTPDSFKVDGWPATLETVFASYVMHWVEDKREAVKRMASLLPKGGKLVTIEEWPLLVNPSPFIPKDSELMKSIQEHAKAIPLETYYALLLESGLQPLLYNPVIYRIDKEHRMYGHVFVKQ